MKTLEKKAVKAPAIKILTPKRRKLLQELAKGKTITEAERIAGYSTKYPGQSGSQALRHMRN